MTSTELGDLFDLLSPLCQQISHHAGPLNLRGFFNLHSSFCTWWWFGTQLRKWNYYVCCSGDVFLISLRHLQNIILNISICIVQSWIVVYGSTFGWMTSTSLPLAAFAVAFFSAFPILGGAGCPAFSSRNRPKSSTSPSKLCICLRRIPNDIQGGAGGLAVGWVDLDLGSSRLVGRYCSYLQPKQAGGTPKFLSSKPEKTWQWAAPLCTITRQHLHFANLQ